MGLSINSNPALQPLATQTARSNSLLTRSLERLGSGLRINRAADDAAGLAIAQQFNTLARQSRTELNSLQSGVSAAQTADSSLGVQSQITQRVQELAVQSANGSLTDDQRQAINAEAQQLLQELDSTAQNTTFNGQNLLDQDVNISLTPEGGTELSIATSNTTSLGLSGVDLSTADGAAQALEAIGNARVSLSQNRGSIGAQLSRFASDIEVRQTQSLSATASESAIRDADLARISTERATAEILLRGNISALVQGNLSAQSVLRVL